MHKTRYNLATSRQSEPTRLDPKTKSSNKVQPLQSYKPNLIYTRDLLWHNCYNPLPNCLFNTSKNMPRTRNILIPVSIIPTLPCEVDYNSNTSIPYILPNLCLIAVLNPLLQASQITSACYDPSQSLTSPTNLLLNSHLKNKIKCSWVSTSCSHIL